MSDDNIELSNDSEVYQSIRETVADARQRIYTVVNSAMVEAYWEIGRQIHEAQGGTKRAEYGKRLIEYLSKELTAEFGKGFNVRSLREMRQFYTSFPIRRAVRAELSWTHYRLLIRIDNQAARNYYLHECIEGNWSTCQLERQINTHTYERLLSNRKGKLVEAHTVVEAVKTTNKTPTAESILKDPYVLEFLTHLPTVEELEGELERERRMLEG